MSVGRDVYAAGYTAPPQPTTEHILGPLLMRRNCSTHQPEDGWGAAKCCVIGHFLPNRAYGCG
ncbi:hypothetical protein J6590_010152 [Homalodisca vitripennis]|nr:hypothetical protein J6590_010152 [Homalodisca vitripennis]